MSSSKSRKSISSAKNPTYRSWKELLTGAGIRSQKRFLLMGKKLVDEVLADIESRVIQSLRIHSVLLTKGMKVPAPLPAEALVFELPAVLFDALDELGTHSPLLEVDCPSEDHKIAAPEEGLRIIAPLGDPQNLGALIRSAAAFGVKNLALTKESASPFLPKAMKASSSAALRLRFSRLGNLYSVEVNPEEDVILDLKGENLQNFSWPRRARLILGEEGPGVPDSLRQNAKLKKITIPMAQKVESLNVTVAASLAMFAYRSQHPI